MTTKLERAAMALAAKMHECAPHISGAFLLAEIHGGKYRGPTYHRELAALEAALATAPIEAEAIEDLPRMIELEKRNPERDDPSAWQDYERGWNDAIETAAALVRSVLVKGESRA